MDPSVKPDTLRYRAVFTLAGNMSCILQASEPARMSSRDKNAFVNDQPKVRFRSPPPSPRD
jgi:hypothetical protein